MVIRDIMLYFPSRGRIEPFFSASVLGSPAWLLYNRLQIAQPEPGNRRQVSGKAPRALANVTTERYKPHMKSR